MSSCAGKVFTCPVKLKVPKYHTEKILSRIRPCVLGIPRNDAYGYTRHLVTASEAGYMSSTVVLQIYGFNKIAFMMYANRQDKQEVTLRATRVQY